VSEHGGDLPGLSDTPVAVELRHLRVILSDQPVLRGIDLSHRHGVTLALVGPNGAGKSTLLRVLAGLLRPASGDAWIDGRSLAADPWYARRAVGMVGHQPMLHPELTAHENLALYARLYGLARPDQLASEGLARVGLTDRSDSRVSTLSRGMVQRVALARALLHDPSILHLDAAETGLDARARDVLEAALRGPRTALIASHDLSFVREVADAIAFMRSGRIVGRCRTAGVSATELAERYAEAMAQRPTQRPTDRREAALAVEV
jgi:ABC-type multidrug transport system ATPase subunit